jgi:DDE superfamily endonuclease
LIGDLGYVGIQKNHAKSLVPHRKDCRPGLTKAERKLTQEQRRENRALSRIRIAIEHVNRRLKIFKILSERYRNRGRRFGLRFNLICAIYNYEYVSHRLEKVEMPSQGSG